MLAANSFKWLRLYEWAKNAICLPSDYTANKRICTQLYIAISHLFLFAHTIHIDFDRNAFSLIIIVFFSLLPLLLSLFHCRSCRLLWLLYDGSHMKLVLSRCTRVEEKIRIDNTRLEWDSSESQWNCMRFSLKFSLVTNKLLITYLFAEFLVQSTWWTVAIKFIHVTYYADSIRNCSHLNRKSVYAKRSNPMNSKK